MHINKKYRPISVSFIFIMVIGMFGFQSCDQGKSNNQNKSKQNDQGGNNMELHTPAFKDQEFIPAKFSCKGEDINPELTWEDVPENTKSFALSIKDPDAPTGTFVHWLVYNIDKDVRKIEENSVPGKQVENNFGKKDYGGPCPPSGVHRYYFRLYALDVKKLGKVKNMDNFDKKVEEHTIAKAELMGKFEK